MLPNPRFSGAANKASCDRQLAHFRPVFTRIPADPHDQAGSQGRAVALLPKPFTRSDLATAVRTALEAAPH